MSWFHQSQQSVCLNLMLSTT